MGSTAPSQGCQLTVSGGDWPGSDSLRWYKAPRGCASLLTAVCQFWAIKSVAEAVTVWKILSSPIAHRDLRQVTSIPSLGVLTCKIGMMPIPMVRVHEN